MAKVLDLKGRLFGRLTVVRLADGIKPRSWVCQCACGATKTLPTKHLTLGYAKSCGCLRSELTRDKNRTHGLSGTYTYYKWQGMWRRVRAPVGKNECYVGVSVCDEWKSYDRFLEDMGPCVKGESLDRIDSTRGYCKENCRWVPLAKQASNTSRNVYVELEGEQLHVSEAARRFGIAPDVVFDRVNKLGWDIQRALTAPLRKMKRRSV